MFLLSSFYFLILGDTYHDEQEDCVVSPRIEEVVVDLPETGHRLGFRGSIHDAQSLKINHLVILVLAGLRLGRKYHEECARQLQDDQIELLR